MAVVICGVSLEMCILYYQEYKTTKDRVNIVAAILWVQPVVYIIALLYNFSK
jgi:hypothetical protein